ncbi:MAG: hypothetical protein Q9210_002529 [Variospora velana]
MQDYDYIESPTTANTTMDTHTWENPGHLDSGTLVVGPEASYRDHFKQPPHIEALEARLSGVKAAFHVSEPPSIVDPNTPAATFSSIEARIQRLESRLGTSYSIQEPTARRP